MVAIYHRVYDVECFAPPAVDLRKYGQPFGSPNSVTVEFFLLNISNEVEVEQINKKKTKAAVCYIRADFFVKDSKVLICTTSPFMNQPIGKLE